MISQKKDGDINIRIKRSTNYRLKTLAARHGMTVKSLIDFASKGKWL